jgi:hypothetical protein
MGEEEILAAYSTPGLRRNQLTRASKKLMIGFDAQHSSMSRAERDEFLDRMFPEEPKPPDSEVAWGG